jgi:signal transduction histidine kinase/streptogramin lyase
MISVKNTGQQGFPKYCLVLYLLAESFKSFFRLRFYLIVFILFIQIRVRAQTSEYIGLADGLGTKALTDITMDDQGCMWITSYGGLYRHEGSRIRKIKDGSTLHIPIEKTELHAVFQDKSGQIWAASLNGLYKINPATFEVQRYFIRPENPDVASVGGIYSVFEDHESSIWISSDEGLYRKEKDETEFVRIPTGKNAYSAPGHVTGYKTGVLTAEGMWFYTRQGMVYYNSNKKYFEHAYHNPSNRKIFNLAFNPGNGASSYTIKGNKNDIWFISNHKYLTRYDYIKDEIDTIALPQNLKSWPCCQSLALEGNEGIWIGLRHGGLYYYDFSSKVFRNYINDGTNSFVSSNYINALCPDYKGRIWVGSDNGINIIDKKNIGIWSFILSNEQDFTNLKHQIGTLSYGCDRHLYIPFVWYGFYKINPDSVQKPYRFESNDNTGAPYFLYCDGNRTWYGNTTIFTYEKNTDNIHGIKVNFINEILSQKKGYIIWMYGEASGKLYIKKFDGSLFYFNKNGHHEILYCTGFKLNLKLSDYDRSLWYVGNDITLIKRNLDTGLEDSIYIKSHLQNKEWSFTNPRSLEDDGESVWITSQNGLLRYYYNADSIGIYTTKNGISSSFTFSVIKDSIGGIWVTSLSGIDKFDPDNQRFVNVIAWPIESYMDAFGSSFLAKNGDLHFAVGNKYFIIQPEKVNIHNLGNYHLIITQLNINGQNVDYNKPELFSNLTHDQNRISVRYGLLKFLRSNDVKMMYRLSNLNSEWLEDDTGGELNFNALSPAKYVLQIKATDLNGKDISDILELKFSITPHFSQTIWFRSLITLLFMAGIYLLYQIRLAQQLKIEKIRNKIAADLHDDVASTVSSISFYSEYAKSKVDQKNTALLNLLHQIGENSRESLENIRDVIWSTQSGFDTIESLQSKIIKFGEQYCESSNIHFSHEIKNEKSTIFIPPDKRRHLYLICKETVNNAIRHAGCRNIHLTFEVSKTDISIKITDDGKGFDIHALQSGNGLRNIKERAHFINAKIIIQTNYGEGTSIQIICP